MSSTGVAWYVGVPGAGKTTLAADHAAEAAGRNRWPVLALDSSAVEQLEHMPHVGSIEELEAAIWQRGEHAAWTPSSAEDVDRVAELVLERKRANVLVDEAAFWISSRQGTAGHLLRLMRAHRHAEARVFLTTQHLSADVPQVALSCAPVIYVFRCTAPAVLERLRTEYGLDPELVRNLPRGAYLRHESGFSS